MTRHKIIFAASLFFIPVLLAGLIMAGGDQDTAVAQEPAAPPRKTVPETPVSSGEYLIGLALPDIDMQTVPAGMEPGVTRGYARQIQQEQAAPVMQMLAELQRQGQVTAYRFDYDKNAIVAEAADGVDLPALLNQEPVVSFVTAGKTPECVQGAGAALQEQAAGMSLSRNTTLPASNQARLMQADGVPVINVWYYTGATYTSIDGEADPNVTVTMRVLRSGVEIASGSTTSNSSGGYYFYPSWQSCPSYGYDWVLQAGDVVEVTAGGNTASTTVVDLSVSIDPTNDTISGVTAAGRAIDVELFHFVNNLCTSTLYGNSGSADGNGNFSVNMGSQVDFNRTATANIYARDANGHSTRTYASAQHIAVYSQTGVSVYLPYGSSYTLTHKRGGTTLQTVTGVTDNKGYAYAYLSNSLQSGDTLTAAGGGKTINYTFADLSVTVDAANNRVTGTTAANRAVSASVNRRSGSWYAIPGGCSYEWDCVSGAANGAGNFTLNSSMDVLNGDYAYVYSFDNEGNYQSPDQVNSPLIAANTDNRISGYWRNSYSPITVILQGSTSYTTTATTDYNGYFSVWVTLSAGDTVAVGNGVITETMTIQNITTRLNNNGHITGTAPNGNLLIDYYDFKTDTHYGYSYCQETTVVGGSYDTTINGTETSYQDSVTVYSRGADGHYTWADGNAFGVFMGIGSSGISGKTETASVSVNIDLIRGGSTIFSTTETSSFGSFWINLNTPLAVGDVLQVQTSDGDSASITIPALTVANNVTNNSVYGTAPANKSVYAAQTRQYNGGSYSAGATTVTDNSGSYSLPLDGYYYSKGCTAVDSAHSCARPYVWYYAASYSLYRWGDAPADIAADAQEPDDSSGSATAYAGGLAIESHTFHTATDEDWTSFTVTAADVGQTFYIDTLNYGWGMGVTLNLVDVDGSTVLTTTTGYEEWQSASIVWTPSSAGTYYVQMVPPTSLYTQYCDARFDLQISRAKLYLPVVLRP